ncbi:MAG: hypothetical protein JXB62_05935 [Pirellulales bacterium]|nr:hypothetical protein [Pirellulales bacterium]
MHSGNDTYYNLKRLHLVFAVSSLGLLAVTIWMLAADHYRPWKEHQRTFRGRIEPWMIAAQIDRQRSEAFLAREEALTAVLDEARRAVPARNQIERFAAELESDAAQRGATAIPPTDLWEAYDDLAARPSVAARDALRARLDRRIAAAAVRHENAEQELRFRRAEFDEARSYYEAGVGEGLSPQRLASLQQKVDQARVDVDRLAGLCEVAVEHHRRLEEIRQQITAAENAADKALADHRATLERLQRQLAAQRSGPAGRVFESPLIDALGRPPAIEQIWLPGLTIDYNFCQVARFDRCATCHQAIGKTQPGRPAEPMIGTPRTLTVTLATPGEAPRAAVGEGQGGRPTLRQAYGLVLAAQGVLEPEAPTVAQVLPNSSAAFAELRCGDVITRINDEGPLERAALSQRLLQDVAWGERLTLEIRRGLPQPYCSHPRPALYLGSLSPHPMADFGCTMCHDGQGSATQFTWASHTPNDLGQRARWRQGKDWSRNPHWDFPMMPRRFAQSRCLKCHHAVTDLEPSRRFPDPPAASVVAGYQLIGQYGCFGCHEIKGFDDTGRSVGPDLRLEPNYAEAALALSTEQGLTERQRGLARRVVAQPEDDAPRRELANSILADGSSGSLSRNAHRLARLLAAEPPVPGTMRKVGPSLRDLAGKVKAEFLADWMADPRRFLPSTRMPRFYGVGEQLGEVSRETAARFEVVEILATVEYLLAAGRPVEPAAAPRAVTEPPSAERGRRLFAIHGCLACHPHADFPQGQATQGPDLTSVGAKFATDSGRRWLVSWIRNPARHSPRTLMPNPLLEPIPLPGGGSVATTPDPGGDVAEIRMAHARTTDPAADVAAYLLAATDWQPTALPPLVDANLDELALLHLGKVFSQRHARQYLQEGIPLSMANRLEGDAVELLGEMTQAKKLRYVGRRVLRTRGCFACHDVPGLEDAQAIGPALSDWGRKRESLLAFGQVHRFLEASGELPGTGEQPDADRGFFLQAVLDQRREGFLWQKLRAPRSFDFRMARNKGYDQWLTMPRFELTDPQREQIITFVLGLVAEPPAGRYVYRPDRRGQAIVEGRRVLQKYACAQCHTLEMSRWTFELDPDTFQRPPQVDDYDLLRPQLSPERIAASLQSDLRGLASAEVVGMPQVDADGKLLVVDEDEDDSGNLATLYSFTFWEPAAIHGEVCAVGGADVLLWGSPAIARGLPSRAFDVSYFGSRITGVRPAMGGTFARLLFPTAWAEARAAGSGVVGAEVWGSVPPPLTNEGSKVRPDWLHDYLLNPVPVRPACMLRMPRFSLSPAEAGTLADYFAAVSGVDFPYAAASAPLPQNAPRQDNRLDQAMRMLVDTTTYCAKCHLVGDFSPGGEIQTVLAPNLGGVGRRLRPEYLRRWLADPRAVLPYTRMPVNFPPTGQSIDPKRFPGSSFEQLDTMTDLLLDYQGYLESQISIRQRVLRQREAEQEGETPH